MDGTKYLITNYLYLYKETGPAQAKPLQPRGSGSSDSGDIHFLLSITITGLNWFTLEWLISKNLKSLRI